MYLITKWFGTFLIDKKEIKEYILFQKNSKNIAEKLKDVKDKKILPEEKKIIKNQEVIVNEKRLSKIGEYKPKHPFFKNIEINPIDYGFTTELLHSSSILTTNKSIMEQLSSEDLQVIQMINALDDMIQISNLLSERLDAWSEIPTFSKKSKPILNTHKIVKNEMKELENNIEEEMKKLAPNISDLVGPLIGARLIAFANGMKKLAFMPASTIQILGAERAFFRFKKEGGKPPKHGIIFQHPLINKSPHKYRGKIARILATKIAIASRADLFTKRNISKSLKKEVEKRIKNIRKQ